MRGAFLDQGGLFSYISPDARVPRSHPLRNIRELVREVLIELSRALGQLYASEGRPSIPPEQLLSALLRRIQREGEVVHLVAHRVTDLSDLLAGIGHRDAVFPAPHGRGDEAPRQFHYDQAEGAGVPVRRAGQLTHLSSALLRHL